MKKTYLIFLLAAILFLQSGTVFADRTDPIDMELNFEVLGREEGLSNLSVSTIIQDKYGFLWFGTQGGLNCYDGREVSVFRNDPFEENGLIHNLIQTMYYDEENHELWIGTYQGISHYIISENRFVNYSIDDNNLSDPIVIAIQKDENGDMWFGTMNGLNKLEKDSDTLVQYEVPGEVVRSLLVDSKNRMLIGTYEGLYYFDVEQNKIQGIPLDLPSLYVMTINEFEQGVLSLGLWDGGVVEVDMETNAVKVKNFADNRVYSILKTEDGTLWVGTWGGGLFREDINGNVTGFMSDGKPNSLTNNIVYSMFEDQSGIVWLGTNGGGINKINPRKNNFLELAFDSENDQTLSQGKINKVMEDRDGNLWVAIYNNGLNIVDAETELIEKYNHDSQNAQTLPSDQVNEFYELEDEMLLGTHAGLIRFDKENKSFSSFKNLPKDILIYAIEKVNDDTLWLGTYNSGLLVYDMNEETYENLTSDDGKNPIVDNMIYDIYKDSKERVWIATNNGLNMKEPDSEIFQLFKKEPGNRRSLASNTIRSIYEDSKGRIWIAMVGGGVAYYVEEDGSFVSFTEQNGLPSNIVTGVVEDDKGAIWCATENGIAIIQPETSEVFYLTPDDGIGGWEFTSGVIKASDHSLVFGGSQGITRIPSSFISIRTVEPRVYITDVFLFHKAVDENRQFFNDAVLRFSPNDSHLEFRVVALDYDAPEGMNFSYKLEGFDADWVIAGKRDYIAYSNLPAGDYELKVIAKTVKNISTEPVSLKFSIAVAWYKSIYAYLFYLLIASLIFAAFLKLREGRLTEIKNEELGTMNGKLEEANSKLEQLSTKDSLTKLFNRRYFDMMFDNHLKLSIRGNTSLALLMIDLDEFKQVNDKYGHVAGDHVMIDVAERIRGLIGRATDFVARYGGDEFAVVLYDTDLENTMIIAKKIAMEIRKVKVDKQYTSEEHTITASIGIACEVPKLDATIENYIDAADRALYKSKEKGRDQISVDHEL